jgi:hypothetical protein
MLQKRLWLTCLRWVGGGLAATVAFGCGVQTAPTVFPSTVKLYGVVQDTAARPLSGIMVGAELWTADCSERLTSAESYSRPATDASGRYALLMRISAPATHCVHVLARRLNGVDTLVVVLPSVPFRLTDSDSVRVDLRLQ